MIYNFLKIAAYLAVKIYCKKTVANFQQPLSVNKPTIIACNHPNSFFDAIIIAIHYPKPIYFLARGDAFKNHVIKKLLTNLHLIPIYRLSEGKENLSKNHESFKTCLELLKNNQTILIFPEGVCKNEWHLRPLKKGTARLALMALKAEVYNLEIIPANINYSSFRKNPKEIEINFNTSFEANQILQNTDTSFYYIFMEKIRKGILDRMVVLNSNSNESILTNKTNMKKLFVLKILLQVTGIIGFLLNNWFYYILKKITEKQTKNTVFYDSVLFGLLLIFYPIMVLFLSIITSMMFNITSGILLFFLMPISGWLYKTYKIY